VTTTLDTAPTPPTPPTPPPTGRTRRPKGRARKPVRRFMIVSHRWLSLVLGLVLLAITTSGSVLLYRPELQRFLNSDAYAASPSSSTPRVTMGQAMATVRAAHPGFDAQEVVLEHGVLRVTDFTTSWTVDPSNGRILGHVGKTPGWLGFLDNLHECGFSCEGMPGYISWLAKPLPYSGWLGYEGAAITGGGLILGIFGLLLLYLSLTGLWLWFPRPRQWRNSMRVRWKRGRFARDTDLHKVAGMIALPALLVWAVTGAGFVMGPVEKAWYAATPGSKVEHADPASAPLPKGEHRPDITIDEAVAAAQTLYPRAVVRTVAPPAKGDATGTFDIWMSSGTDPYGSAEYPGNLGVGVDRHTGKAAGYYGVPGESVSQSLWEQWNYPTHSGYVVNGWWRLIWFVFGLSPLLLAITGISTWLVRRRTARRRRSLRGNGRSAPATSG